MSNPEKLAEVVDQVISKVQKIHPNFAVLSRLSNFLNSPNTDMEDIVDLIKRESSLSADIVAISNSSLYGLAVECADVESALARIGFNDVLKIVSLLMAKSICSKRLEYFDISPHQMWAESVTVSFLMEGLSTLTGVNKAKAATCGIVHNMGRVLTDEILVMFPPKTSWDGKEPIAEWEDENIGINYGEAGARFLKSMQFPQEVQDNIRNHVYPGAAMRSNPICHLLRYSVLLFKQLGFGFCNKEFQIPDLDHLQPEFEVSEADILEVVEDARIRYRELNQRVLMGA